MDNRRKLGALAIMLVIGVLLITALATASMAQSTTPTPGVSPTTQATVSQTSQVSPTAQVSPTVSQTPQISPTAQVSPTVQATECSETVQEVNRTIQVSGTGQVSAVPDVAMVSIGVQTEAVTATLAISQNNQLMQAVIGAIMDQGVPSQDIQTQVVQLTQRYGTPVGQPAGIQVPIGFMATNTVRVRVTNLATLGDLLDAAVQAGANQIQNVQFEVSSPGSLLDQARSAAWQDALHKATQLAQLAGAQLGPVQFIAESSNTPVPVFAGVAARVEAVPIQPGVTTIEVDLQVTWQLR